MYLVQFALQSVIEFFLDEVRLQRENMAREYFHLAVEEVHPARNDLFELKLSMNVDLCFVPVYESVNRQPGDSTDAFKSRTVFALPRQGEPRVEDWVL